MRASSLGEFLWGVFQRVTLASGVLLQSAVADCALHLTAVVYAVNHWTFH